MQGGSRLRFQIMPAPGDERVTFRAIEAIQRVSIQIDDPVEFIPGEMGGMPVGSKDGGLHASVLFWPAWSGVTDPSNHHHDTEPENLPDHRSNCEIFELDAGTHVLTALLAAIG